MRYNSSMPSFEFSLALSARRTEIIYRGTARYIVVESEQGPKLQLPAGNFRAYVDADGIHGRFRVRIDDGNRILSLERL